MRSTVNQCWPSAWRGCDLTDAHLRRGCIIGIGVLTRNRFGGVDAVESDDNDLDPDRICRLVGIIPFAGEGIAAWAESPTVVGPLGDDMGTSMRFLVAPMHWRQILGFVWCCWGRGWRVERLGQER